MKKTIWVDFTNTPHVHFLIPIIILLRKKFKFLITARDFSETVPLLEHYGVNAKVIGKHRGKSRIAKLFGILQRIFILYFYLPKFDIALAVAGLNATQVSWLRRIPVITFKDNEVSDGFITFPSYYFCPNIIDKKKIIRTGIKEDRIIQYKGLKENIYLAYYKSNPDFLSKLPFKDYVVVRPENLKADYVPKNIESLVPDILSELVKKNFNVVFIPRYEFERSYAPVSNKIFIPEKVLNGLDLCFNSSAVITGAGTLAREATVLGVKAVSFFPGKKLLGVDKHLINNGSLFHSRNVLDIINYVELKSNIKYANNSKEVFRDLILKLNKKFRELGLNE